MTAPPTEPGCNVIIAVIGAPVHPVAVGVIVKVTVTVLVVVFVNVPLMFPPPDAAIPVAAIVLSRTQLNVVPATFPESAMVEIGIPEQTVWVELVATAFGVGLTTTEVVIAAPVQPFAVGVTVKVTVIDAFVVFVSGPLILPLPLAAIPVTLAVLFLVQLNVVEAKFPDNTIVEIFIPEQIVWAEFVATAFGSGFTVTAEVIGVPVQPLAVGVTVNVTTIAADEVLISVPVIFPLPLAAIPVTLAVLFLVQLNVVAATVPVRFIAVIGDDEQTLCVKIETVAVGVGFTITLEVIGVPSHPFADGVIVKVVVIAALEVLVKVPVMELPTPFAAMPVIPTVLFRDQE